VPAATASAALIVAGSLAVGQAVLALCGHRRPTWLSGPVGLALLLAVTAIVANAGGRGTALAITLGCLVVASAAGLGWAGLRHGFDRPALLAALLAALFASLPFIAAGQVGILGVGLVNDDMASHLLLADWIGERFRPEPVLVDQGYPLGPHSLVIGIGALFDARTIDVFAGLTLAIPALTALVAFGALRPPSGIAGRLFRLVGGTATRRALVGAGIAVAVAVALPYMTSAYLTQEAFKEPILALFVVTFALLLPTAREARTAIPLGVLAAGTVYVYSFPGLAWLIGTAVIWATLELGREHGRRAQRTSAAWTRGLGRAWMAKRPLRAMPVIAALTTTLILIAPELPRLADFTDFRALDPDRANEGGLGNLRDQISPLTAFGIWPTSEFRLSAGAGDLPAIAFYAGAAIGIAALIAGLPGWIRRYGTAIPAALATAALLYVAARLFGTVYTSAKAIAIAAPLVTLIALGGLLATAIERPASRRIAIGLGAIVVVAGATSSFLILRQAPVGPEQHMDELAEIRSTVQGRKLLFLGRDNFVSWELRGSKPFTHVRNFYDPFFVEPNTSLRDVVAKFDADAVEAETLGEFPYVLTTRAAYASGLPPGYRRVVETESYVLWKRGGAAGARRPAENDAEPGAITRCGTGSGIEGTVQAGAFLLAPVAAADWSRTTVESGDEATIELRLPPGEWELSLQYDSTRPLTLRSEDAGSGESFEHTVPANLDYRGAAPFWAAGTIDAGPHPSGPLTITATVERPPLAGRLLGAHSVAHLGTIAATPVGDGYGAAAREATAPFPGSSARLGSGGAACGQYTDWLTGAE
jgi:hypothetical protein